MILNKERVVFSFFIVFLRVAFATTYTWTGSAGDNNWGTAENWSPETVPNAAGAAAIFSSGTYNINVDGNYTLTELELTTTGILTFTGSSTQSLNFAPITSSNLYHILVKGTGSYTIEVPIAPGTTNTELFIELGTSGTGGGSDTDLSISTPITVEEVFVDGPGTLLLSGSNTYSGNTNIGLNAEVTAGAINSFSPNSVFNLTSTLNLDGYDNEIYSLTGTTEGILSLGGATLTVTHGTSNKYQQVSYPGEITGAGELYIDGGTFQFNGTGGTYTGSLYVNQGTFEISSGATLGSSSNTSTNTVATGATLTISGTLNCDLLNDFGTLVLNSDGEIICTTLTVESGASLQACGGTITATSTTNSGTTEIGCSVESLTINGDFTFLPGSILSPSFDAAGFSTLVVSGDATLGNDVALILRPESDCYEKSHNYAVLTAGGAFSGTFAEVEMGTHLLIPHLTYGTHGVELTVARTPIRNFATGDNAAEVAEALESLADSGYSVPCSAVKKLFFSSRSEIETALESMDPALFKGQTLSQENNVVKIRETLSYRMQDVLNREHCWDFSSEKPKEKPKNRSQKPKETPQTTCKKGERVVHLWIDGFGDYLFQNNITFAGTPQIGYQTNTGGGVVGLDYHFAKVCYVGALGAYTGSGTE
ncbi:MAG TPA: hypothetical protein VJK48_00215, partial [Chlamydiales bacterium]|nr:hypothetical protein [Chlamydiales bacterium]